MGQFDWNVVGNIGNLLAAIFTGIASVVSLWALLVSLRTSRHQQQLSERIAKEQNDLLFEQVRMQRDSDVIAWSHRCIAILSEIESVVAATDPAALPHGRAEQIAILRHTLSGAIDQGRLFFPNDAPDSKGADKPAAYQGVRQRILGVLVSVYDVLASMDRLTTPERRAAACKHLLDLRRHFVSEAQLAIEPRRFMAIKELNGVRVSRGIAPQTREEAPPNGRPGGPAAA